MSTPHITLVREQLLATLAELRSRDNPMDVDRARAIAQVAGVLVDTAKVEVDYIKATGADRSDFLEGHGGTMALPAASNEPTPHNPFPNRVHRLQG